MTLIVWMFLLGCARMQDPAPVPSQATSRDYEVYAALVDTLLTRGAGDSMPAIYVIVDSTMRVPRLDDLDEDVMRRGFGVELHPFAEAARSSLLAAGAASVPLDRGAFGVRTPVQLVSRAWLDALARRGAPGRGTIWPAFRSRFPEANGYLALSRPGYAPDGTHALVHYARPCGEECGDTGFVLLRREGGAWRVLKRVITIIS